MRRLAHSIAANATVQTWRAQWRVRAGIEVVYPNTMVNYVKSADWQRLLGRIGPDAMLHLLTHTAIFVPLENASYMQVCGVPIANRCWSIRYRTAATPTAATAATTITTATTTAAVAPTPSIVPTAGASRSASAPNARLATAQPTNRRRPSRRGGSRFSTKRRRLRLGTANDADPTTTPGTVPATVPLSPSCITVPVARPTAGRAPRTPDLRVAPAPAGARRYIDRARLFYNGRREGQRRITDLLMRLRTTARGARRLLIAVLLQLPVDGARPQAAATTSAAADARHRKPARCGAKRTIHRLPRWMVRALPLFARLLHRHARCQMHRICNVHCPLPDLADRGTHAEQHARLVRSFASYAQVVAFVRSCLRRIVPPTFYGSRRNRARFESHVAELICLRRFEKYASEQLMRGIRTGDMAWLPTARAQLYATRFFRWLIEGLVLPLLSAYFYVTETAVEHNRIFYYRKPVWRRLSSLAIDALCVSALEPVSRTAVARALAQRSFGYSFLRLLPKPTSMRPITNMSRRPVQNEFGSASGALDAARQRQSINAHLQNVHHVLALERARQPGS